MTHAMWDSRTSPVGRHRRHRDRTRARSIWAALSVVGALASLSALASGCGSDGIVGGDCAPSYTACALSCVDLTRDPANCGACGVACSSGELCASGVCDVTRDGRADGAADGPRDGNDAGVGVVDGSSDDATAGDGTVADSAAGDSGDSGDGSSSDGSTVDVDVGDACTPPYNTPQHCGSCATACSSAAPVCYSDDGIFYCVPICPTNRVFCASTCVDTTSDPLNCGTCGNVCASALCVASLCTGAAPKGHIVTIGHAYGAVASTTSQARVLANAAFLSTRNPLRVLSFEQYASTTSVTNVETILTQIGTPVGRTVAFTALATTNDLPQRLTRTDVDVFIVHDQRNAPVGGLATIGATWSPALATFVSNGGVVIVLDGMGGTTREMNVFLTASALLTVPTHTPLAFGAPLTVARPLSSVGSGVVSPYGASTDSASYTSPETQNLNTATIVVDEATHAAVVVHKAVY